MNGIPESCACAHCGMAAGIGYGGTPECQQQWYGSAPRPPLPGCLIAKQQLRWAQQTLGHGCSGDEERK